MFGKKKALAYQEPPQPDPASSFTLNIYNRNGLDSKVEFTGPRLSELIGCQKGDTFTITVDRVIVMVEQ